MNEELMIKAGFGQEVELVRQGKCPMCKEIIKKEEFKNDLSRKEFDISGLCQKCQDDMFY